MVELRDLGIAPEKLRAIKPVVAEILELAQTIMARGFSTRSWCVLDAGAAPGGRVRRRGGGELTWGKGGGEGGPGRRGDRGRTRIGGSGALPDGYRP